MENMGCSSETPKCENKTCKQTDAGARTERCF